MIELSEFLEVSEDPTSYEPLEENLLFSNDEIDLYADPATIALVIKATAAIATIIGTIDGRNTRQAIENIERQLIQISKQLAEIDRKLDLILAKIAELGVKLEQIPIQQARVKLLASSQTVADNYSTWSRRWPRSRSVVEEATRDFQENIYSMILWGYSNHHYVAYSVVYFADLLVLQRASRDQAANFFERVVKWFDELLSVEFYLSPANRKNVFENEMRRLEHNHRGIGGEVVQEGIQYRYESDACGGVCRYPYNVWTIVRGNLNDGYTIEGPHARSAGPGRCSVGRGCPTSSKLIGVARNGERFEIASSLELGAELLWTTSNGQARIANLNHEANLYKNYALQVKILEAVLVSVEKLKIEIEQLRERVMPLLTSSIKDELAKRD